ncbi:hypothetical protein [Nonomuraea sp. SYSU D8015]|uniref:hypothetical protein n=1 Tax=Nonomuraea sp. SYSU D8015 TaxID=2593644 RepID=UPI001CB702C7|nr:hypothetical protein [Nonomuraea sp. SYSU D8015]
MPASSGQGTPGQGDPDRRSGRRGGGQRARLPANVCGERVRVALMEARPAGLTLKQLAIATGMSVYYVRKGLLWIKDTAAMEQLTPLTWTAKEGFRFPPDPADWIAYERRQFHTELTRITRLITATIAPHASARPGDKAARIMLAQLEGVRATFESLVTGQ